MIYIYNSNNRYQKQIEYTFMTIFYQLGLAYITIRDICKCELKPQDILLLYTDDTDIDQYINNCKNTINIKQSVLLFGENYLKTNSIPNVIKIINGDEHSISIFSSNIDLYVNKDLKERRIIETNIDIISDIFFMLTRYEEVVNTKAYENERFNRFPASDSLAFKNDFLDRPIVNEHIDLLWSWIDSFNLGYKRKNWWGDKDIVACLTHDVDSIQKYKKFKNIIRPTASLIIKHKKPLKAIDNFVNYFKGYKKDPFYTFDYIINLEKYYDFKSSFYFMSGGNSEVDNFYNIKDTKVIKLIEQVENEGFEAGYHCSFNSYNNFEMLMEEKEKLDNIFNIKSYGCRQHFLRFKAPYTWRNQEKAGLLYDTTLSFADAEGFRCGTCFPFKPYDLLENRILDIWEIPLVVMEGSLQNPNYRAYTSVKGLEETKKLIDVVKKHKGVFTMLYHNSTFDPYEPTCEGWKETYEETIKYLYNSNCIGKSGKEIIEIITK
ncbi:polysaccharide deacetylase family protein [Clostridium tagluense]|uniref:DUF7033 domain-containing protein n=1 Tax=Clostridium tagluense TaxID=360422 RepID=A0A401UJP2_9CLOT|nr:polysaccharide deacetylase family protein [Clostridium tagluense]GCD09725.1 hypothetical protein Ctaglu_13480 [Clostridium tagluense]